jgi:hypothetical protein
MSAVYWAAGGSSPPHFFARMLSSPFWETRLRTFTTVRLGLSFQLVDATQA